MKFRRYYLNELNGTELSELLTKAFREGKETEIDKRKHYLYIAEEPTQPPKTFENSMEKDAEKYNLYQLNQDEIAKITQKAEKEGKRYRMDFDFGILYVANKPDREFYPELKRMFSGSEKTAQVTFAPLPTSKDSEVEEFLRETEELEDEAYADELFKDQKDFELNIEELGTMVDQTKTPDAPGSNDMSPVAMQMTTSPVPTTEDTQGTPVAPIEDQYAIETMNQEDMEIFDFWEDQPQEQQVQEATDKEIIDFIHEYTTLPQSNWTQMLMSAIENGLPETHGSLEDDRQYNITELWEIARDALTQQKSIETTTAEQDEDLAIFEELAESDFELNQANMDEAGQVYQQHQTQPTPGVSNMTGGSSGSQGSQPGAQPIDNTGQPAGIADRTPGGTIGTTPDSAPMSQGYGQPKQVSQDELSIDNLTEDEEDILPPEDEMLVSEFDSLV